jgi:peptidoglycan/LPS O-acetylase OafA/YrhL
LTSQVALPYREDIDGLRAIAVLLVIGFHAFPEILNGGFVGVDVFFVISGYLITSIIRRSLENGNFSFLEFYARRIKRLLPALIIVLSATFAFGWFVLLADEFRQLGKHVAAGATFVSNVILWRESGYFDTAAQAKPLLHLWSLGIEEQYYIAWPLLLWLFCRRRRNFVALVTCIALPSFLLNILSIEGNSAATFYLPQTRIWELLLGSLLTRAEPMPTSRDASAGLARNNVISQMSIRGRNWASVLGAALIAIGVGAISREDAFPGWWALLPTLGTVLVILGGPQAWINRNVLSFRALVWIGLISYPLYLWHWPILTFLRILDSQAPTVASRVFAVIASAALATATYVLIERNVRTNSRRIGDPIVLLLLLAFIGCVGLYAYISEGIPSRAFPTQFANYSTSLVRFNKDSECFDIPHAYETNGTWFCELGRPSDSPVIFVFGDSHALGLLPALEKYAIESKHKFLFAGASGCPPLLGIQSMRGEEETRKSNCQALNERVFEYVKDHHIPFVLLTARWTYYTGGMTKPNELNPISIESRFNSSRQHSRESFQFGLRETIRRYKGIGVRVILVKDSPQQAFDPRSVLRRSNFTDSEINRLSVTRDQHRVDQAWVNQEFQKVASDLVVLIDTDSALCGEVVCEFVKDGKFLYYDDDHLSLNGGLATYSLFQQVLDSLALTERNVR